MSMKKENLPHWVDEAIKSEDSPDGMEAKSLKKLILNDCKQLVSQELQDSPIKSLLSKLVFDRVTDLPLQETISLFKKYTKWDIDGLLTKYKNIT